MAITITNNWIVIPEREPLWISIAPILTKHTKAREIQTKTKKIRIPSITQYAYERHGTNIFIPIGLFSYIQEYITLGIDLIDRRTIHNPKLADTRDYVDHIFNYADILPGITLRNEQLIAIKKILYAKRGIINACTGFGKTEVLCGTTKILEQINGQMPTILLFEPTIKLVNDTIKRFKKYGINAVAYSKTRSIIPNVVNIAHPKSVGIDIEKDPHHLDPVEVMFGDESHHYVCDTFRKPTYNMPNLVYSIGVSASAISQDHINSKTLDKFSFEELLVIGATGPLLLNVTADYLIEKGDLAKPILLRLNNPANEPMDSRLSQDWSTITDVRLHSSNRNDLISQAAKQFADHNRKSLILVNTVEWARILLVLFKQLGLSDKVFASYGSNKFETISNGDITAAKGDFFSDFDSGKYKIMIGTTHLYEGADISKLDAIILGFSGKVERLQIQGLGRALRKSKTGKFAYVIDFTDSEDKILSYHSKLRFKRYKEIIGIPEENIYDNISISDVNNILKEREEL